MSKATWHVVGAGFNCADAAAEKIKAFLDKHSESLRNAYDKRDVPAELPVDISGSYKDELREISDSGTIAEFIAAIMTVETGLYFDSPGVTEDGEDCALFLKAFPWEYNEKEKCLTDESLKEIMSKYADELGIVYDNDWDLVYSG